MSSPRSLDRAQWYRLCDEMRGAWINDGVDVRVRADGSVHVEHDNADVDVLPYRDATDIRVGRVQVLVARDRAAVVVSRGQYPIAQWDVLWEGSLSAALEAKEQRDV